MGLLNKRILVTGGAGFLGSHLCERLLAEGNDVICVDNYFTGRKSNIASLLVRPNFEILHQKASSVFYHLKFRNLEIQPLILVQFSDFAPRDLFLVQFSEQLLRKN